MAVVLTAVCTGSGTTATTTTAAPTTTSRAQPVTGTVGAAVAFAGLELTVPSPPVDPANPADASVRPDAGSHYVRVAVRVANRGVVARSFTPASQAVLFDDQGGAAKPILGLYPDDMAGRDVAPGAEAAGYLSFALPDGRVPDHIVFSDSSGVTTTVGFR